MALRAAAEQQKIPLPFWPRGRLIPPPIPPRSSEWQRRAHHHHHHRKSGIFAASGEEMIEWNETFSSSRG